MRKIDPIIPQDVLKDTYLSGEWDKMLGGDVYDAGYQGFGKILMETRRVIKKYNDLDPDSSELKQILKGILGSCGDTITVNQPFRCDYGCNIHVGENFFANFNLTILDEALVTIGDNCFIGPNVSMYTACHPLRAKERNTLMEWAEPIVIGNNVWIGGSVSILPGVTIGDNCVIGTGSVVTRNIEANTVAVGNPARSIKKIEQ